MNNNISLNDTTSNYEGISLAKTASIPQVMELTLMSDSAVRSLIAQNKVKAFRAGRSKNGKWLINMESLRDFLDNPR